MSLLDMIKILDFITGLTETTSIKSYVAAASHFLKNSNICARNAL